MTLLAELQRRNVFRVAIFYIVSAWLFLQIADLLFEVLLVPDWTLRFLFGVLVLAFPFVLFLAWAYELTPEGIKREADVDRSASVTDQTGQKLNVAVIVVVLMGVAAMLIARQSEPPQEQPVATVGVESSADRPLEPEIDPMDDPGEVDQKASIAVLPFANMSAETDTEYFSDGLAESVLHLLAQVPDLRVAARTSAFQFKGKNLDVRDIARELGVANVLEGSVRRQGDQVRVTAQLIRGDDGSHLWSEVFDRKMEDVFAIQDEIAEQVSNALQVALLGPAERNAPGGTDNLDAYEAFLRGTEAMQQGTPEAAQHAIAQLELAVSLDPDYALAWARLSNAYLGPAELGAATWESTFAPRRQAAQRALDLDPELADAHLAMASAIFLYRDNREAARVHVERALQLSPSHAGAQGYLATLLADDGQFRDALRAAERAILLDPLSTQVRTELANYKASVGLVDEAIVELQSLVDGAPNSVANLHNLGSFLVEMGRYVDGMRVTREAASMSPGFLSPKFTAMFASFVLGDLNAADLWLQRVEELEPDRALEDRMVLCIYQRDRECVSRMGRAYIDLQNRAQATDEARRFEAVLQVYAGDPESALPLLESLQDQQSTHVTRYVGQFPHLLLALYHEMGMQEQAMALAERQRKKLREAVANGMGMNLAAELMLGLAAANGDAEEAATRLAEAMSLGWCPSVMMMERQPIYDRVWDHPAFQAQLERKRAMEAEMRAEVAAMGGAL
jgi:TolB-like protein/cytochrome c-type biogenesis protein CcmH/NrfG